MKTNGISLNQKLILESKIKIFWDFEINTDHLIHGRKLNLVIISDNKKKTCYIVSTFVPVSYLMKNTRK